MVPPDKTTPPTVTKRERRNAVKLRNVIRNCDVYGLQSKYDELRRERGGEMRPMDVKGYLLKYHELGNGTDECIVEYRPGENSAPDGRLYAKGGLGLQGMMRIARHTIASEFYRDVDICNAHNALLAQWCEERNIPCPHLKHYVENRDAVFDLMPSGWSRDTKKMLVLKVLNGGAPPK